MVTVAIPAMITGMGISAIALLIGLYMHRVIVRKQQASCDHVWRLYRQCPKCNLAQEEVKEEVKDAAAPVA